MKILFILLFAFSGGVMAIEEPDYTIISKKPLYEIRQYGEVLVAETKVDADFETAGEHAFKILAGFIFGDNKTKTKISMTAPVMMNNSKTGYHVQFTMPKEKTMESMPIPNNQLVEIKKLPPRTVAVFTYSGSWSMNRYLEKLEEFQKQLSIDSIKTVGEPVLARFNSPF